MTTSNRFESPLMARIAAVCLIAACTLLIFAALVKMSVVSPLVLVALGLMIAVGVLVWRGIGSLRAVHWLALFSQPPNVSYVSVFITTFMLTSLFLLGAFLWVLALGGGQITFRISDWRFQYQYYHLMRQALITGQIPYFASGDLGTLAITNRYFAVPEVPISPQMLLLGIFDVPGYLIFNAILLFAVSYAACILFLRRYQLSIISFAFLLFAFTMNGYVVAHIGVGHTAWFGYHLFPFMVYFVLQLVEGNSPARAAAMIGVLLLLMGLQGAIHMVAWWVLFLGILAVWHRRLFIPAMAGVVIGMVLYMPRIWPVLTSYSDYAPKFIGGFRSIDQVLEAFVVTRDALYESATVGVWWWEFNMYLGAVGFALMAYFGLVRFTQHPERYAGWQKLIVPLIAMSLLSMNFVYSMLRVLPIPLISGQRVTTRILALPVAFIIAIAAIQMQRWLDTKQNQLAAISLMALAVLVTGSDLIQHLLFWSIPRLEYVWSRAEFKPLPFDLLGADAAATAQDHAYVAAVNAMPLVGAASLLIAAGIAFALVRWERSHHA